MGKLLVYGVILLWWIVGSFGNGKEWVIPDNHLRNYQGQEVAVTGRIVVGSYHRYSPSYAGVTLDVEQVNGHGGQGLVKVGVIGKDQSEYNLGQVKVNGRLKKLNSFANPGTWDSEEYALVHGLAGKVNANPEQILVVTSVPTWWEKLQLVNRDLREKIAAVMSKGDAAILAGMVLGGYEGISKDVVREFSTTGIIHILSVSGSHIAMLIGFCLVVFGAMHLPLALTYVLSFLLITWYSLLCGFSPPVLRSLLMGIVMLVGLASDKRADRGMVLGLTAFVMLCYRPLWLWDVGFILSFGSTAGIIYLYPVINSWLKVKVKCPRFVREGVSLCLAAQFAVLPIIIYYFHQISLSSLLANLIVVPIIELVLVISLTGLAVGAVIPIIGKLMLVVAAQLLGIGVNINGALATLPYATVTVARVSIWSFMWYYVALVVGFGFVPKELITKKQEKIVVICSIIMIIILPIASNCGKPPLTIYFWDVGQGDSALIVTPERKTILIDAGGLDGDYDTGERIVWPCLRYLGIRKLDVLHLSHGHHDHAGGAVLLAKVMPVEHLWLGNEPESKDVEQVQAQLQGTGTTLTHVATGDSIKLGSVRVDILYAPCIEQADTNEASVIMQVSYQGRKILFTGDATANGEGAILEELGPVDVLKVGHHGSGTSSSEEFIARLRPRIGVISVGRGNLFGHPHPGVVARLQELNTRIYRTDNSGAIKVVVHKDGVQVTEYRKNKKNF